MAQPDATRLDEHDECEMRALCLLREERAQISYLIAQRRKGAVAAWLSTSRVLSEPKPSRIVSALQLNARWNCARTPRQSAFRLDVRDSPRNERRRDSPLRNPFEFRQCCDPASWHSTCSVKSVDVLGYLRSKRTSGVEIEIHNSRSYK